MSEQSCSSGSCCGAHVHQQANVVRVSVPAEVAFSLEKMNKVTAGILGRLGCPGCHSGFDIRFLVERDFVVNAKLEIGYP